MRTMCDIRLWETCGRPIDRVGATPGYASINLSVLFHLRGRLFPCYRVAGVPEFSHLHLHTQYSLLDGAIRLEDLFPQVLARGMKSVAITDHGNLFGALDFNEMAL